jgi:hypothetical protein
MKNNIYEEDYVVCCPCCHGFMAIVIIHKGLVFAGRDGMRDQFELQYTFIIPGYDNIFCYTCSSHSGLENGPYVCKNYSEILYRHC